MTSPNAKLHIYPSQEDIETKIKEFVEFMDKTNTTYTLQIQKEYKSKPKIEDLYRNSTVSCN